MYSVEELAKRRKKARQAAARNKLRSAGKRKAHNLAT
jgi:hypothetical protein